MSISVMLKANLLLRVLGSLLYSSTNGGSEVPVAAGAGDTNMCGGIIQLYWNSILERCLDINDQVRQSALKIVEVVLRQGLVHPVTCVPHLIALEMDPIEGNSKLAHHLLMNMNEKYPSFFESRLGDGLQMSFKFLETTVSNHKMTVNMKSNPIAFVKPGITRIYRLIRANRNSRNKFVHSIVRKFEPDGRSLCTISFLVYCAEVLASLPFTCPDEPLYLIYDINRVIHLRAGATEANLKRWVSMDQHQDMMGVPSFSRDSHIVMQPEGYSEHYLDVSERMLNNPCGTSDADIAKLQEDCHDAIALQLLLKLKRHLKFVYSSTDARCQAFSLKELPKSGETLSKPNVPFNIGINNISLPSCLKDAASVYKDFKTVLQEDTTDFGAFSATVQRRRPTPRNSSRKKVSTMLLHLPCRVLDPVEHASVQTKCPLDKSTEKLSSYLRIKKNDECSSEKQMVDAYRSKKVPVFVSHCSGMVCLNVKLDEPSQQMMQLFQERTKMKSKYYYFQYENHKIDPSCTLLSYGIGPDATIKASGRLLGGKHSTLSEYFPANKDKFLREVTRPDGTSSVDMNKKGCRILSSLVKCFTRTFSKRKSWAGMCTLQHFEVIHEHVTVLIHATQQLDRDNLKADMRQLVRWIKATFSLNGKFPPYLENLIGYLNLESIEFY